MIARVADRFAPYAVWFFRLALGATFLGHVRTNLFGYVPPDTSQLFGLAPGVSALGVIWELLVAVALIIGIWPRAAALAGTATLFATIAGSHFGALFARSGSAWEHPAILITALIVLALAGDGAFALVPTASNLSRPSAGRTTR